MNNRIKQFMDHQGLSSSELADSIGVQRSNVTHVLQGRNKPGFQFISKLLETYPEINAKWLITGQGEMLMHETAPTADLFSQPIIEPEVNKEPPPVKEQKQESPSVLVSNITAAPEKAKSLQKSDDKEIERIVVFYTDQTFKQYRPSE